MTEELRQEIRTLYREAKKKRAQMDIMVDLFALPRWEIEQAVGLSVMMADGVTPKGAIKRMDEQQRQTAALQMLTDGIKADNVCYAFGITHDTLFGWKCKAEQQQAAAGKEDTEDAEQQAATEMPKEEKRKKSNGGAKKWTDAHEKLLCEMVGQGANARQICAAIENDATLENTSYSNVAMRAQRKREEMEIEPIHRTSKQEAEKKPEEWQKEEVSRAKLHEAREKHGEQSGEKKENRNAIQTTARFWQAYLEAAFDNEEKIGEKQVRDMLGLYRIARGI